MRKADYAALAEIICAHCKSAEERKQMQELRVLHAVALQFAQRASVDRAAFLKACGIE